MDGDFHTLQTQLSAADAACWMHNQSPEVLICDSQGITHYTEDAFIRHGGKCFVAGSKALALLARRACLPIVARAASMPSLTEFEVQGFKLKWYKSSVGRYPPGPMAMFIVAFASNVFNIHVHYKRLNAARCPQDPTSVTFELYTLSRSRKYKYETTGLRSDKLYPQLTALVRTALVNRLWLLATTLVPKPSLTWNDKKFQGNAGIAKRDSRAMLWNDEYAEALESQMADADAVDEDSIVVAEDTGDGKKKAGGGAGGDKKNDEYAEALESQMADADAVDEDSIVVAEDTGDGKKKAGGGAGGDKKRK
eukprot:INCI2663.1.p1 GENE.INCI2663.1~~INCI2663.1.p1  ORF type:complete len:308 (-),score=82.04 INCI2663.1:204-1127(-)